MTEGAFFQDLALLMAVAGSVSFIFSRFKWPKVIGYILAGVLLSRHVWGASVLVDEGSVQTIGQLGIVFLMFTMGLGLSMSEMRKVSPVALPIAVFDTVMMIWVGFTIGRSLFGWGTVPSLFLGAAICDSATTLLAKIIDEMRWGDRPFVKYVLGTSVCEDVVCVGVIALITGVAQGHGMDVMSLGKSLGGLAVFFVTTLVYGLVFVPRFLNSVARRFDDETLLLTLLGCCFFVTYIAYRLQFSLALGAFLVGVLGAGADVKARLARLVAPLRSMFAAVFFVSIGLLVNPAECWAHLPAILLLAVIVAGGKLLNCTIGALAVGLKLKPALQTGFSLAQIGEFAYMVALLYVSITGDVTKPMYQIVVGVSLLTTLANPWMIRVSDRIGDWAEKACPERVHRVFEGYRAFLAKYRESTGDERRLEVRKQLIELVVSYILCFAIALGFSMLNGRDWSGLSPFFEAHKRFFFSLAMNVLLVSIWVIVFRLARSLADGVSDIIVGAGEARWQQAFHHITRFTVMSVVLVLAFLELIMININLAPEELWARVLICVFLLLAAVFGWRFFLRAGRRAAENFSEALKTDERLASMTKEVTFRLPEDTVATLVLPETSPAVAATIGSLNVRAKTGAIIIEVFRGDTLHQHIGPDFEFRSGDRLIALGDGRQIALLKDLLGITV